MRGIVEPLLSKILRIELMTTDTVSGGIHITDIGVTLRTLLAVAAEGYKEHPKRVWRIAYGDNNEIVGSVRIRNQHERNDVEPSSD